MAASHHFNGDSILFDGASFISQFTRNPFVEKGYCPGNRNKDQIRLLYAFNKTTRFPVYFYVAPGNIPDVTLFGIAAGEMEATNCVVIFDNGFYKKENIDIILGSGMEFVVPLKRNAKEVPESAKPFSSLEKVKLQHFSYNKRIVYYAELPSKRHQGCKIHVFYDNERHQYLQESYFDRISRKDGESYPSQDEILSKSERFGVTMLLNNLSSSPEEIYRDYKSRWEIEEMFDTHKNTLGFKMNYETSLAAQEAWAFIEFLALQMFYKIDGILINNQMIKSMNVGSLLFTASRITQAKIGDKWNICNMTKNAKELYTKLGIEFKPIG
jgi:transposase